MEFVPTEIPAVIVIRPRVFADARGFFLETYRRDGFAQAGIHADFVQDNHSGSKQGILRGLHYQIRQAQGKLVRVILGQVFDVVVDLRKSSPTFGQWTGVILSGESKEMLWVPPGFAHGFYVLSEWAEFTYKTTDIYAPQWERCIRWDDPDLKITWPLQEGHPPLLSPKDLSGRLFREAEVYP